MNKAQCLYLGIDTSNYTTSVALCDGEGRVVLNLKRLLSVKQGERGLRQSDALFAHTKNLPDAQSQRPGLAAGADLGFWLLLGSNGESQVRASVNTQTHGTESCEIWVLWWLCCFWFLQWRKLLGPPQAGHWETPDLLLCG